MRVVVVVDAVFQESSPIMALATTRVQKTWRKEGEIWFQRTTSLIPLSLPLHYSGSRL